MLKRILNYFKNMKQRDMDRHITVAQMIGDFYLDKNKGSYEEATKEIMQLGITQLKVMGDNISITLMRPGLLIGRKGVVIDSFRAYLHLHLNPDVKLDIIEEKVLGWLIPYEPYNDDDIDSALFGE